MDPFSIAALGVGVLGALASSGSSYSASKRNLTAVRETNETNLNLARETNASNMLINQQSLDAQMRMQQQAQNFNSPTVQASLLRQAGLNPALNDSMAGSIGASSVPSSIPMQAPQIEAPLNNYSDTYIDSGLRALASAAESYTKSEQGFGTMIDNQTRHEMNLKELERRDAEIQKLLEDKKMSRAERKRLNSERESINLNIQIIKAAYEDVVKQYAVQNRLNDANADLALQKVEESRDAVLTSKLNRILNKKADARAEREINAIVSKMSAEVKALAAQARLTESNAKIAESDWEHIASKYVKEFYENKLLRQTLEQNDLTNPILYDILEQTLKQAQMDYDNPVKQIFGNSGAGAVGAALLKR